MPNALIFDEMPIVRKVAERVMKNAGYDTEVFEARDDLARRLKDGATPDILILSVTGGNTTILDDVRDLRRRENGAKAVILISVVERNVGLMMRARRAGANGILTKPFDARSFNETLEFCLKGASIAA